MSSFLLISFTLALFTGLTHGQSYAGSAKYEFDMATNIKGQVNWKINGQEITFELICPAEAQWIGLGFNAQGEYKNSDFYLAWTRTIAQEEKKELLDGSITSYLPSENPQTPNNPEMIIVMQDPVKENNAANSVVVLAGFTRNSSFTSVTFRRKLNTCDGPDDQVLRAGTTNIILAYGTKEITYDTRATSVTIGKKIWSKMARLNLFAESGNEPVFDGNMMEISIPNSGITDLWTGITDLWAEKNQLQYACKLQKLPSLNDESRSIIGYVSEINGNLAPAVKSVHLFMCKKDMASKFPAIVDKHFNCLPDATTPVKMVDVMSECQETIVSWFAVGKGYRYPLNMAYPVGKTEYENRYVLLRVVIDTNQAKPIPPATTTLGTGTTGMRLQFSDDPSKVEHKIGFLTVSTRDQLGLVIPPKQPNFRVRTVCDIQCTNKYLTASGGITLFSVIHQTRRLGVGVITRLIRGGKVVQSISDDVGHSSDFQELRPIKTVHVQPGDQILVECTFDSSKSGIPDIQRQSPTFSGHSVVDELCATTFGYYPRVDGFFTCGSSFQPRHLFPMVGIADYQSAFATLFTGEFNPYAISTANLKERLGQIKLPTDFPADKCLAPRANSLYFNKRHMPFCGLTNLGLIDTDRIEVFTASTTATGENICPGEKPSGSPDISWEKHPNCSDVIYPDEIADKNVCRNSAGIVGLTMALSFLCAILLTLNTKNH